MNTQVITRDALMQWLSALASARQVYAPVIEAGKVAYRRMQPGDTPLTAFAGPGKSLRELFTPETEVLFEYEQRPDRTTIREPERPVQPRLVFGARACDTAALKYMDTVYGFVDPPDQPYFDRRANTALVGLFCTQPAWSCFCTAMGDALTHPVGMDIWMTDLGDRFLAEPMTDTGEALLGEAQTVEATEADLEAARAVRDEVLMRLPDRRPDAVGGLDSEWSHAVWAKLADRCLGCGACSFVCPTCHCFDIQDCSRGRKGVRFRCWDTCQFEQFTLMGHGHNPRPSRTERTRQRIFHKFKYSQERYNMPGCTGCGRCVAACPVNIDLRTVLDELGA